MSFTTPVSSDFDENEPQLGSEVPAMLARTAEFSYLATEAQPGSEVAAKSTSDIISPLPGSLVIGCGYDVFDRYASGESVNPEPLFDFDVQHEVEAVGRNWLLSNDIVHTEITDSSIVEILAHSKDEYSQQLAAKLSVKGGYGLFSASINSDFDENVSKKNESSYVSILVVVKKWKLGLRFYDMQTLRSKLKPGFREALASENPSELFDAYGTYYLSEVLVGGRANYVSRTTSSAFESDRKLEAAAMASFNMVSGSASASDAEEVKKFRKNSSHKLYTIGGNPMADIQDSQQFSSWMLSIDEHPVFSGFTNNSLKPIWHLAETEERRQVLKLATEKYVPAHLTRPVLLDLKVISSVGDGEYPPYGYSKINFDLNRDSKESKRGNYIYVCQKREEISVARIRAGESITGIKIVTSDSPNPSIPDGYVKIDKDLNEGRGGKYIYMCYTKLFDETEEGLPIRSVCVVGETYPQVPAPAGFEKIPSDLNEGSEGDYIYLCYSRHFDEAT